MTLKFNGYEGARLAGEAIGDPDAPAVLLLPDAGRPRADWADAAAALVEAGRQAILVDLRGQGDSPLPANGRHDLDSHAGDLRAVLESLRSRPVVVAAGVAGDAALIALGEAGEHLAAGLVLADPAAAADHPPAQAVTPRLLAAAGQIRIPTLLVGTAPAFRTLAEAIPGAVRTAAADAGTLAAADRSDAFNALLLDFLEQAAPHTPPEYRAGSDPRTLRDALGCFGTGVTVITTRDAAGQPVGLTANSFTSVSLDPPLLLVCLAKSSSSLPAFLATEIFAVNVLHTGQQTVSGRFASRSADRFAGSAWETWDTGAPILKHSLASFDCLRTASHDAGDHVILIGQVQRVRFEPRRDPLLYFRGRYRRLHFS